MSRALHQNAPADPLTYRDGLPSASWLTAGPRIGTAILGAMSAILLMYTIDRQYLPTLKDESVLLEHAQDVGQEYDWSGYCMLFTLMYLEERGVSFDSVDEYTVLTPAHRTLLDQLHPARHDAAELDAYLMEAFGNGEDGEGWAGRAAQDSLRLLHDNLEHLVDCDVLLVKIS
jgi:hypothetical protein